MIFCLERVRSVTGKLTKAEEEVADGRSEEQGKCFDVQAPTLLILGIKLYLRHRRRIAPMMQTSATAMSGLAVSYGACRARWTFLYIDKHSLDMTYSFFHTPEQI